MGRKTFEVAQIVDKANEMLKNSAADMVEFRTGVIAMVEGILHDSGNYEGYRSLQDDEVKDGNPGCRPHNGDRYLIRQNRHKSPEFIPPVIIHNGKTTDKFDPAHIDSWFIDTDDTRRQYALTAERLPRTFGRG